LSHQTKNHVYGRLRKKAEQAKRVGGHLPAVVVLCDAGCHALSSSITDWDSSRAEDVIDLFLNGRARIKKGQWMIQDGAPPGSRRIAAVVIVSVHERSMTHSRRNTRELRSRTILSHGIREDPVLSNVVERVADFITHAPPVARMPINARSQHKRPWHYGGASIASGGGHLKIKISLLAFQDLLAGRMKFDTLRDDHPEVFRAIHNATSDGLMISNMRIEHCPDADDDWVEIEFSGTVPGRLFV